MAYIGVGLSNLQTIDKLDNITLSSSTTYNLTKGGVAFTPISASNIICSINGVVQYGNFTTSNATITFTGASLTSSDVMDFIFHIGEGVFLTPNDGSITSAKLSTDGISAGNVFKVNDAGNGWVLGNASSAEIYGFKMSYNSSTINITVTDSGGKYVIDGVSQKTLELYEGNTYVFTHPSAHPFRFSTDSGNTSAYTTGVTVNSSTQVTIVVASGAPTLYYYCSSHSGMGGQANTPVPANNSLQVTTTNGGNDNISGSTYANFDDVVYASTGFSWSLDNNGHLIATI